MGIYRIYPNRDTWISNYAPDGATRMTASNHGASPALNVFARKSILPDPELARILLNFSVTELSGKIFSDSSIPSSGVSYYLKLFNMEHGDEVPSSYDLFVYPITFPWDEGKGIDDDNGQDSGFANWYDATSTTSWVANFPDYYTVVGYGSASQHFDGGNEDLEVDVTTTVNAWINGDIANCGMVIKLPDDQESNGVDYLYKKFHGRETLYIEKLPYLEARWDDVKKDNRNNFAFNINNTLYMYNLIRGELTSIPNPVSVRIQDNLVGVSASYINTFTAGQISDGVLTSSIYISNTSSFSSSIFYDIWYSGSIVYMTGTFTPLILTGSSTDQYDDYVLGLSNFKRVYSSNEEARIKVAVTKRNYKTHRGTVASASLSFDKEYIEKIYYSVINDETGDIIIPFGTGSVPYTQLSYNNEGNYFNFFMENLVPGFKYRLKFLIDINKFDKKVIDGDYVFRVV